MKPFYVCHTYVKDPGGWRCTNPVKHLRFQPSYEEPPVCRTCRVHVPQSQRITLPYERATAPARPPTWPANLRYDEEAAVDLYFGKLISRAGGLRESDIVRSVILRARARVADRIATRARR